MHPVLFEVGPITIYTYGFFIAVGAILGVFYLAWRGKKKYGLTSDQANTLFLLLIGAGVIGGKLFMIFEDPSYYLSSPKSLLSGSGFVFYGSLLTAIPVMLWYFRKQKLPVLGMLDIMAVVTGIVHGFGRIGCFNAGCCYGTPTSSWLGVVFTDTRCQAEPLGVALHPTQLYEAAYIFSLVVLILALERRKSFDGQLFLVYLIFYAIGRAVLENFRGDLERGFVFGSGISNSQLISLLILIFAVVFYVKLWRKANLKIS